LDLSILRRTAAELVAAAICELFPGVELLGGGETSSGFFYEFRFSHPLHAHQIEEKMREMIKERRPIRTLEMVAFSAAELLKKEGHQVRLQELEGLDKELVELIQIGSFYDLCEGPHLKNTAEIAAFKIELQSLPEGVWRVEGWGHYSKELLKQFLKKLSQYTDPQKLGEKMGFWQGSVWLAPGLAVKSKLLRKLKEFLAEDALEVSAPKTSDRMELLRALNRPKLVEVLTCEQGETQLQTIFFNQNEKECISSLQSIGKTLTMLGFDHSTLSKGREADYLVEDELGVRWPVIHVKKVPYKGSRNVDLEITAGVEKIFSLLLEKNLILKVVEL
jgi:hypothetical protein